MHSHTGVFKSFDNREIFFREWEPKGEANGRIVLLLHRGHEHSGRLEQIAQKEEFSGYKIFSYDNRGHGSTKIEATFEFMDLVRDLDSFVRFVLEREQKDMHDIFIVANSVAGVVASTWMHDYAPDIRGVALVAPAFRIKLYFPWAKELLKVAIALKPDLMIKSYVKSKFLTHDRAEQEKYDSDTLITPNIPAGQLTTLLDTAQRVVNDAALIGVPTMVLSATKDYVVDSKIQGDFYANLSSKNKRFVQMEGFYHGILYEQDAQKAVTEIASFMESCFDDEQDDTLEQMIHFTKQEQDRITYGSLPLSHQINYSLQRLLMHNIGHLSQGIAIGLKYGFDSGVTLDYVYHNQPSGKNLLGKWMDVHYLQSIGWRGIRERKVNMINAIEKKIATLKRLNKEIKILDIAGGPARYLIEIAQKYPDIAVEVRDYQIQNIEEGRALAKDRGLRNITYQQSDAFDAQSYDKMSYSPNIVIISGIFELFDDNSLIQHAINGVERIIEKEGFLLYTNQPWHPQLEQIAHVLGNHQDKAWIMRRRSQYEIDQLFGSFRKESMAIDNWGIFSVSSAQYQG
jgi:alpha-beta hydrolase superfamily lysophospholipase/ubiquinone/menaquinone biosynthesis C-methylase UbiE